MRSGTRISFEGEPQQQQGVSSKDNIHHNNNNNGDIFLPQTHPNGTMETSPTDFVSKDPKKKEEENNKSYEEEEEEDSSNGSGTGILRRRRRYSASKESGSNTSYGGGGGTSLVNNNSHNNNYCDCRAVLVSRLLFLMCLIGVAVVLAILTFKLLSNSERNLAESQYSAQAEHGLEAARDITVRKRDGTVSMASVVSQGFAHIKDWPYIALTGYEVISTNLIATSSGREMGLCPIVQPGQIPQFEAFAYDYFQNSREPEPFPNGTAVSSFGEGIWAKGPNPDPQGDPPSKDDGRYRVTTGNTTWDNKYEIVTPIIQHNAGAFPALMLNLFFERNRGKMIESVIDCSTERKEHMLQDEPHSQEDKETTASHHAHPAEECGGITDMLILTSQEVEPGPGALIMQPIYPAMNNTELAGVLASSIVWDEVLVNVFAEEVSGVDCVLETETLVYTYRIDRGVARYRGEGDLHDPSYNKYRRSVSLTGGNIFSHRSASYTLTTYPTSDFFDVYSTQNPRIATIGAVLVMLLTSGLFILYDFFVRREFNVKGELLQAKRRFVRFISHEVRTPLNSVCMGLTLLQQDIMANLNDKRKQQQQLLQEQRQKQMAEQAQPVVTEDNNTDGESTALVPLVSDDEMKKRKAEEEMISNWLEICDEVMLNARTSVDVLNDILNYDKIENKTLSMEYEPVHIWRLIHRTVQEFKLAAQQKGVNLDLCFSMREMMPEAPLPSQEEEDLPRDEESAPFPKENNTSYKRKSSLVFSEDNLPPSADSRIALGDNVRLTQVLRNLISNAVKFTPEGGTVQVRASYREKSHEDDNHPSSHKSPFPTEKLLPTIKRRDSPSTAPMSHNDNATQQKYDPAGYLKLKVTDTGAGMTQSQCEQLFQEGVQFNVNSLQAGGGSGLGLFIAKGIVEQHHGQLKVASEGTSKGTTFTMTLPLFQRHDDLSEKENVVFPLSVDGVVDKATSSDGSEPVEEQQQQQQAPFSMPEQPAPMHVLVVEDSAMNRKLLCRLIRAHGHEVVEAVDGQQAVDLVRNTFSSSTTTDQDPEQGGGTRSFDTILMDYEMPVLNGPDAVRQIRAMGCDAFVVGITGNVLPDDVAFFKSAGANSVLPKPFQMNDLEELWIEYGVVSTSSGISGLRFQG